MNGWLTGGGGFHTALGFLLQLHSRARRGVGGRGGGGMSLGIYFSMMREKRLVPILNLTLLNSIIDYEDIKIKRKYEKSCTVLFIVNLEKVVSRVATVRFEQDM
jgi:hypothetical protein